MPAGGAFVDNTCAPKDKQGLFSPLTPFPPLLMYVLCFLLFCPTPWCTCIMYVHTYSTQRHTQQHDTTWLDPSPPAVTLLCKSLHRAVVFSQPPKEMPYA